VSLATKLVLGGVFAVVLAICVVGAIITIVATDDSGSVEVNLGDDTFAEIDAGLGAELVAEQGPLIFPDPTGGTRPLLVQHLGDDPDQGWFAMQAVAPGTEACIVEWQPDDAEFRDCEGTTYPADGAGLIRFAVTVVDGKVTVDLRVELDEFRTDTTTPPTSAFAN
jgi:hypothetical protein